MRRFITKYCSIVLFLANFISLPANANIQGGSIQFMKPKAIAIARQDVTLSLDKVTSNYVFLNNSALEIIETLVFPAPHAPNLKPTIFEEQPFNQLNLMVDGREVEYKTMLRPTSLSGEDLSDLFETLHISPEPQQVMATINNHSNQHLKQTLLKHSLLDLNTNTPLWNNKTFYYWQQKFPPAKEVHISQTYKPYVKIYKQHIHSPCTCQALASIDKKNKALHKFKGLLEQKAPYLQQFCPTNKDYIALLELAAHEQSSRLISRALQYNLVTSDHWSSSIGFFTLKIEQPEKILALSCFPHKFETIAPGTLMFSAKNYVPQQDLAILFLQNSN